MADDMRDLVLDHLKTIQSRPSAIELDMGDVRMRVSTMEQYQSQVLVSSWRTAQADGSFR